MSRAPLDAEQAPGVARAFKALDDSGTAAHPVGRGEPRSVVSAVT
ncbi:hypothetical protein FHR32_007352 [Streptosporangium album]|uniref:Uncharacterized protein n=1 Tax=Streptosporangium album TaxID=47479 RepID=A0A7W7S3R5_9ACTN|nr:hypothetical protein [Streptosporangium album]